MNQKEQIAAEILAACGGVGAIVYNRTPPTPNEIEIEAAAIADFNSRSEFQRQQIARTMDVAAKEAAIEWQRFTDAREKDTAHAYAAFITYLDRLMSYRLSLI